MISQDPIASSFCCHVMLTAIFPSKKMQTEMSRAGAKNATVLQSSEGPKNHHCHHKPKSCEFRKSVASEITFIFWHMFVMILRCKISMLSFHSAENLTSRLLYLCQNCKLLVGTKTAKQFKNAKLPSFPETNQTT